MTKAIVSLTCALLLAILFFSFVSAPDIKRPKKGRFISVSRSGVEVDFSGDSTSLDSFLSSIQIIERVCDEKADSMLNSIDNFNLQIDYGQISPFAFNAVFVRFNYKGVSYSLSDMDAYYMNQMILPNIENDRYDWAYNAICYAQSASNANKLKSVKDINEWRLKMKKSDLLMWKSRKWK